MSLVTLWRNYLPWTQAVVVAPLIARARSNWMRSLWYFVLCATTAAFVVHSFFVFIAYFDYPKTTNIRLIYEPEEPFPAVTFCNLNPYKKSTIHHSPKLMELQATYTYVSKQKQAEMKRETPAAARTATASLSDKHAREKRQGTGANDTAMAPASIKCETRMPYWNAPQYRLWTCYDGTNIMEFGGNDTSGNNKDMASFNDTCRQQFCVDFHCASCSVVRFDAITNGMDAGHYCKCGTAMATTLENHDRSTDIDNSPIDYKNRRTDHHCDGDNHKHTCDDCNRLCHGDIRTTDKHNGDYNDGRGNNYDGH